MPGASLSHVSLAWPCHHGPARLGEGAVVRRMCNVAGEAMSGGGNVG